MNNINNKTFITKTTFSAAFFAALLFIGSVATSTKIMFANATTSSTTTTTTPDPSKQCEDAAKKISDKAEASQSDGVCTIELTRDSPSMQLLGHKFNEFTPQEVRYGTVGNNNVLMIFEFTLLASEINPVIKSFEDNHVDVTAVHNHWLFEHPTLYYLHAEKTGNLNTLLQDAKDALDKTSSSGV